MPERAAHAMIGLSAVLYINAAGENLLREGTRWFF
ncbi:hypothetical protein BACCAP_04562 [Pseudoflavonifractor capillosus ATCC 29799]|uniref:Uncharacterized protein n=1 Tax=Pseudoflavonifractor capillosus ATCC 29799 TaxID=411467 RepID=A6P233_9FIRM|nr:hypothetical protein BACCAP_04562 [Pseudoflavonifractor capillosus ATCC 29799]